MPFDHSGKAVSRIISQYRDDTKMRTLLSGLGNLVTTKFEAPLDIMRLLYSIDDMFGAQLDLIGRVLVQPRPSFFLVNGVFFGYEGTPNAGRYDEAPYFDPAIHGGELSTLPDDAYRNLLKAKAAKNNGDATIENILEIAILITGDAGTTLTNNQDMTFELIFTQEPSPFTAILLNTLNVIPEPAGVSFAGWSVVP